MNCPRCRGLMVIEEFNDYRDTGEFHFIGFRCLICGEILDPMIFTNRKKFDSLLVPFEGSC
jgi:hypothetical protein